MINVNAALFATAHTCVSKEETRYYLNGVYVEKCDRGGVLLVATDGHRLMVIHDKSGICEKPAIIALDKVGLSACGKMADNRRLTVDQDGKATVAEGCWSSFKTTVIDGTFPGWRHIVDPIREYAAHVPASFNGGLLGDFGKIASMLTGSQVSPVRVVTGPSAADPALVLFSVENAFGVLMPMRGSESCAVPAFMTPLPRPTPKPESAPLLASTAKKASARRKPPTKPAPRKAKKALKKRRAA